MENTDNLRKMYRNMLFSAPGLEKYISGIVLHDETFFQNTVDDDKKIVTMLTDKGIIPGIKVDKGISEIEFTDDEVLTLGLDGLKERCVAY